MFERSRRLKAQKDGLLQSECEANPLCKIEDADVDEKVAGQDNTVYLIFMEGSTRTRESLRNAASYHGVKVNEFQAESSSFQKNETITDTMKMLTVYSTKRSVFVVRSPLEGVCSWLQTVMANHASRFGIPPPSFINAGDGRNAHPLSELADVFSLLEVRNWDRNSVHIALVGDLAHGRTAHSKVEGLRIFKKVRVDLVAPASIALPVEYRNRMRDVGFEVREYTSVEEYMTRETTSTLAPLWYFFQPQFGRLGDVSLEAKVDLREKISFRPDPKWRQKLPDEAKFFQTLPRDKENPIIPLTFDDWELNGWDTVSGNSYFLHVVLISMFFGKIGKSSDCAMAAEKKSRPTEETFLRMSSGQSFSLIARPPSSTATGDYSQAAGPKMVLPGFIENVDVSSKIHARALSRAAEGGSVPVKDGIVIDHIGTGSDASHCWKTVRMLRLLMGWHAHPGSEGVYSSRSQPGLKKGLLSLPNFDLHKISVREMKMIASIAPGSTVNAVASSEVVGKFRLKVPERIYDLPNIGCKNKLCIANPKNKQRDVVPYFERIPYYETSHLKHQKAAEFLYKCTYCKYPHQYEDIWLEQVMFGLQ